MKPYYQDKWVKIFLGDCREILPQLDVKVDLVLTDPPYPEFNKDHGKNWDYVEITNLKLPEARSYIFWAILKDFPLSWTAKHVWHKPNGQSEYHYEYIYERFGDKPCRVFRVPIINYRTLPEWTPHPTQKPQGLINQLLILGSKSNNLVFDPFLGSGTTCYCAKKLNRYSIGIEIEEKYCEIAARRCSQEVMELSI